MFSIPVVLAFVVGVLTTLSIVNAFVKSKKLKKQKEIDDAARSCEDSNFHKKKEDCWCCQYDLSKEQITEIIEKHGVHLCGKDSTSIVKDNELTPIIAKKLNIFNSTAKQN